MINPSAIGKDIVAGLKGIGEKVKTMYANNAKARVMYTEQVKAGKTPLDAQKAVAAKYGAGQSALSSKAGSAEIPSGSKGLVEIKKLNTGNEITLIR